MALLQRLRQRDALAHPVTDLVQGALDPFVLGQFDQDGQ